MVYLTTFLAFATAALAAPAPVDTPIEPAPVQHLPTGYASEWKWDVTGWEAGCSRGGCSYLFNVSVPAITGQPLHGKYYCNGYENTEFDLDNYYVPCEAVEGGTGGLTAAARFQRRHKDEAPKQIEISVKTLGTAEQT